MKPIYTLVLLLVLSGTVSCKKMLEPTPSDFLPPQTHFNTEAHLNAALNGVYDALGGTGLYGSRMTYRLGLEADEGYYARTSPASGPQVYNFTASDGDVNLYWSDLYRGITRANMLLANINNNPAIPAAARDRIRGEALFLRGYYYFMLVQTFGGVPLVLQPTLSANDTNVPKSTIKQVYDQILADMTTAEGLVAPIKTLGFSGRVSQSAVRGILARVCLHMAGFPLKEESRYAEARDWAKKVMDDAAAGHDLIPNYSQVFINYAADLYDVRESIWEVEFWGNRTDAYTETGQVGYVNGPVSSNTTVGEGFGGIRSTARLYQAYRAGDLRRDWTISNFTYTSSGTKTFNTSTTVSTLYNRVAGKFRREYETLLPKARSSTPQNFPLLRYADVLLMFAEADNEVQSAPSPEAIAAVNKVRQRAWSTGIKSISIKAGGTGYLATNPPTIRFTGGGGTGATATATIASGRITGISFARDAVTGLQNGTGYSSEPTITISGGAGTGATATATIYTLADASLGSGEIASKDKFRETIQNERLRELSYETLRKGDLIRWGIFVETMNEVGDEIFQQVPTAYWGQRYRNVWERHLLWPIPAREMTLNEALVQNLNW